MRIVGRLLSALLVLLIVVIVAAGGLLVWVSHRALPTSSGSFRAAGLAAPVSVTRDISGLINITATTPHDLFLAQGYVHAQATYYQFSVGYPDPYDSTVSAATDLRSLFEMTNLPSYRLDVDMGKLDEGRIVITTGQSGNPTDPHYGDMIDAWRLGQQVPLAFSSAAVQSAAVATLTLTP